MENKTNLSESHSDCLWDTRQGLGLGVVLQEDAIALENHIWLAADYQQALELLEAHRVAQLTTVGRHLVTTWPKGKLISAKVNSGKAFHLCYSAASGKSQDTHVD